MKKKYLVLEVNGYHHDVDNYDCYHSIDGTVGVPTDYVVELTDEEYNHIIYKYDLIFIPILDKYTIHKRIALAKEEAKKAAEAEEKKKQKRAEAKRKREEAKKLKQEEEERKLLAELKEKYGTNDS